ncbi:DNA/RNA helicase domain-containing protein [Ligilactobacillus murinus]|nr:DNA/RNA helicase domain-containing protein [Ligilactobacillus murinus]
MKSGWVNIDSFISVYNDKELLNSFLKVNKMSSISETEISCLYTFFKHLKPLLNSRQKFGYIFNQIVEDGFREEFDILRFTNNSILNIELKTEYPKDGLEGIFDQLDRHSYLLGTLGRDVHAFTYVEKTDELFKIDNEKLVKTTFNDIVDDIGEDYIEENILSHIDSSTVIISPYSEPERFIKSRYFLNDKQKGIRNAILKQNKGKFSISGGAGTGKSLVLFDLAKKFNESKSILYIFVASMSNATQLSTQYGFPFKSISEVKNRGIEYFNKFDVILIDEAQRLTKEQYELFIEVTSIIIFSVDKAQTLKHNEETIDIENLLSENTNIENFKLSQRVRTDKALSTFIRKLFNLREKNLEPMEFPKINAVYFSKIEEAKVFIKNCIDVENYYCIEIAEYTTVTSRKKKRKQLLSNSENGFTVIGREYDNVLIPIDERINYTEDAKLVAQTYGEWYPYPATNNLFEGITRVKKNLLFVVINNPTMFKTIQEIITWYKDKKMTKK